jgi:hypothetical protein
LDDGELTREQLEAANEALREANARLARKWLGKSNSAAASLLARLEAEREELDTRLGKLEPRDPVVADRYALIKRIEELHAQALSQEQELLEIKRRRVWRLARRYSAVKSALLRGRKA